MPRAFYARSSTVVARALLGRLLVRETPAGRISGLIVEVEAYGGPNDPASHARSGRSARNATMFGPPGHAYVYFTYGMHYCLNVVTGQEGRAEAVLIRALEPVAGLVLARELRGPVPDVRLMRGPGCVGQALGLTRHDDGLDLLRGPLWVSRAPARREGRRIASGPRIGIRNGLDRRWRFWLLGHPGVSGPRAPQRPVAGARRAAAGAGTMKR
jgi:DNA-3-methyladenine glycosylase